MPVDQSSTPGHLPARIAGAVAGDPLHGGDQFMVVYAAIVGAGDRAQFNASILNLERLDQLGTMRGQPVLKVDAGERCWQLPQIGSRRADKARELPEAPVGRRKRHIFARQHQRQPLGIVAVRFHPYRRALRRSGSGFARRGRARRRRARTATGTARPPGARTTPRTRGRSAHHGSHPPCSRRAHRERRPEYSLGSWVVSVTGAASLSSRPSTRHGNSGRTLTLWSR